MLMTVNLAIRPDLRVPRPSEGCSGQHQDPVEPAAYCSVGGPSAAGSNAERLLRSQLAATEQTIPNQVNKPTDRPTTRWIFQCFEGIDLLHIRIGSRLQTQVLGLQALHRQVLRRNNGFSFHSSSTGLLFAIATI